MTHRLENSLNEDTALDLLQGLWADSWPVGFGLVILILFQVMLYFFTILDPTFAELFRVNELLIPTIPKFQIAEDCSALSCSISDEDFLVMQVSIIAAVAILSGLGSELFFGYHILSYRNRAFVEWLWIYANLLFPLLILIGIVGMYKFGFPETCAYCTFGFKNSLWKLETWMYILNGVGTLFHHSVAMYYIAAFNLGLYYPTKHVIVTPIPICLQHATHVLKYVAPSAYPFIQLGLEIWFEFEVFALLGGAVTQKTQPYVCFTMLAAHWMYWLAAFMSVFVPEVHETTRASVLSVPKVISAFSSQLFEERLSRLPHKRIIESAKSNSSYDIEFEKKAALRNQRTVKQFMKQSSDGILHNKYLENEKQRLHDEETILTQFRKSSQPGEEENVAINVAELKTLDRKTPAKDLAVE